MYVDLKRKNNKQIKLLNGHCRLKLIGNYADNVEFLSSNYILSILKEINKLLCRVQ